jgi:hypothetical protein
VATFNLPIVNGDSNSWGQKLNDSLQSLKDDQADFVEEIGGVSSAVASADAKATQALSTADSAATDAADAVADVAALPDTLSSPTSPLALALAGDWVDYVRPELYGAVGDGVANDTAALVAAVATGKTVRLGAGRTYLIDPDAVILQGGQVLEGTTAGSLTGAMGSSVSRIVVRETGGTYGIECGAGSSVRNVRVESATLPLYTMSEFDTGSLAATYGVYAGGTSVIEGVGVNGFYRGVGIGAWAKVLNCWARGCDYGYYAYGTDGFLTNSVSTFNVVGLYTGNYFRTVGNRFEWNATYGMNSAGEATIVGNLFDRNGWAGVYCRSGAWGQVITGNYFSRNGCGGDTSQAGGRWSFSTGTGTAGWVDTPVEKSCHIQIDFQRAVTITGNRYRSGRDDSNLGAAAPAFIYSSEGTVDSTGASVYRVKTSGEVGYGGDSTGWSSTAYGGVGKIAGGTDTSMASDLNTRSAFATVTWNPASIAAGASTSTTVTVAGVTLTNSLTVAVAAPYSLQGLTATAYVSATDTVTIVLANLTAGAVDLGSGSWRVVAERR